MISNVEAAVSDLDLDSLSRNATYRLTMISNVKANYRHNLSHYHPDVVHTTRQRQVDRFINPHHPTEHRVQGLGSFLPACSTLRQVSL